MITSSKNENDKQVLIQSNAIMEFLEEMYPTVPLLPKDPIHRATVRSIVSMIACDIHPLQNLRVLIKIGEEGKMEWARHWIRLGFIALEKVLVSVSGLYCFGDSVTLADCCLIPQVYNALRFNIDMNEFPTIQRIYEQLQTLDAFKKSQPNSQPDAIHSS